MGSDSGSDIDFLPYSSSDSNIELDKDQFLSTPNKRKKKSQQIQPSKQFKMYLSFIIHKRRQMRNHLLGYLCFSKRIFARKGPKWIFIYPRSTVKPWKWRPQRWRTLVYGSWHLVPDFHRWQFSLFSGFSWEKLSYQYCYVIKVYDELKVRSERTLRYENIISI